MLIRRFMTLLVSLALVAGGLSGCAQMPATLGGQTLAVDPGDPCGPQRQHFAESQTFFTPEVAVRTAIGAAGGAAAGAIVGGATNGGKGAILGAIIGGVGGGLIGLASGYWSKLQDQKLDEAQLTSTVNADLRTESSSIDATAGAFAALRSCRFAQAQRIKYNARHGMISRDEAQSELAVERRWFDQEIQAAQNVGVNMQKRDEQFAYAADNLNTTGPSQPHVTRAAVAARTAATETIPQKRNSFESSVTTAQAQSNTAFSLEPG